MLRILIAWGLALALLGCKASVPNTADADAALDETMDGGSTSQAVAIATRDEPCEELLEKACSAHNSTSTLVCTGAPAVWTVDGSCDRGTRCDTQIGSSQGTCQPIIEGCEDKQPGESVCDGTLRRTCGADLLHLGDNDCPAHSRCEGASARCVCDSGFEDDGNGGCGTDGGRIDSQLDLDASTNPDAFFVDDPAPPYCGPDPDHVAEAPTGSVDCPSDKNREGCPCSEVGIEAACWPGKRLNREHGICVDGVTQCIDTSAFGKRWGPCEGYVLPVEGAVAGPDACRCFSSGTWRLSNLSPCVFNGDATWLYSSILTAEGQLDCGSASEPPAVPSQAWSTSALNVDCAGQLNLCLTIKAGLVEDPKATDCVVHEACVDVTYIEANVDQALPDLPAWASPNSACAADFVERGGYGEMSVLGESIECDAIDDGAGGRYVFSRTSYCPPRCQATPDAPDCVTCSTGGTGSF